MLDTLAAPAAPCRPGSPDRGTEAARVLRLVPMFRGLSDAGIELVARRAVFRTVARETRLFQRGDACEGLHVVVSGSVVVYRVNAEGKERILHVQKPGHPITEFPLFDGGPYPASARANEDSQLLFLPRDDFNWLCANRPEVTQAVIRELGARLRKMVRLVEKISLKDVSARVAMTLLEYSQPAEVAHRLDFALPRTQEELAAELATTRESVARALSRLRQDRVIAQKGSRVRILDLGRLERIAFEGRRN